MNITLLPQYLTETLGWTLIHWLWQGLAVAVILVVVLKAFAKISSSKRYLVGCAGLAAMMVMPMLTFKVLSSRWVRPIKVAAVEVKQAGADRLGNIEMPVVENAASINEEAVVEPVIKISFAERVSSAIETNAGFIVYGWLIGVFGFCLWHLGGWRQLQKLRRTMVKPVGEKLVSKMNKLADAIGVKRVVSLMESALVAGPVVVGWLKPVILLPGSALTGLNPEQLEAILAHELAHIRRCDYLVNIIQTAVEIVGFYNPAIWWVSAKIRAERENCCDDIAVALTGDRVNYVRALTAMEEVRGGYKLAVAGSGGSLFDRAKRLLTKDKDISGEKSLLTAAVAVLLLAMVAIPAGFAMSSKADGKKDAISKSENSDYKVTLDNGVTVELMGVCEHPSADKQWWNPDGNLLEQRPWEKINGSVSDGWGVKSYEFAFKLIYPADNVPGWYVIFEDRSSIASGSFESSQTGQTNWFAVALPSDKKDIDIMVALATGEWKTRFSHKVTAGTGVFAEGSNKEGVAWFSPVESEGKTSIVASHSFRSSQARIVAVDKEGVEHSGQYSSGTFAESESDTITLQAFFPLTLDQIKEFRLQTRSYQKYVFNNVSLRPGNKTDVQVDKVETNTAIDIKPDDFKLQYDSKQGVYNLMVSINNDSNAVMPEFKLRYYKGDPAKNNDETGNPHSGWHGAGPIEPGKQWNEITRDFNLPDGEYEFSVVLDYDNAIAETDENNNTASIKVVVKDGQIEKVSEETANTPQILTSAHLVFVPMDMPEFQELIGTDITPEKLEAFLNVVRNNPQARIVAAPQLVTNDGEIGVMRTDNYEYASIEMRIANTVDPDDKTIKVELSFDYSCMSPKGHRVTLLSTNTTAKVSSGHAFAVSGMSLQEDQATILLVSPKIMEAGDNPTGIIEETNAEKQISEFKAKLEQPVTVYIEHSPENDKLSLQYAVIAICKAAGVPYNWDKSANLAEPLRRKFIDPLNLKDKVASQSIIDIVSPVGLAYGIDVNGVYLLGVDAGMKSRFVLMKSKAPEISVTVFPIIMTEKPYKNVAEVIALMLEKADVNNIDVPDEAFSPAADSNIWQVCNSFEAFVREKSIDTDYALFGEYVGTPQSGVKEVRCIVVDKAGNRVWVDRQTPEDEDFKRIKPNNPMLCSHLLVERLRTALELPEQSEKNSEEGKWAKNWQKDSGTPAASERDEMAKRLAIMRENFRDANLVIFPTLVNGKPDKASAENIRKMLNDKQLSLTGSVSEAVALEITPASNEQKRLWDLANKFKEYVQNHKPEADYALYTDYMISPKGVGGVHFVICDGNGEWVIVDFQNEYQSDFKSISPKTIRDCDSLVIKRIQNYLEGSVGAGQ